MRLALTFLCSLLSGFFFAQNHAEEIKSIHTLDAAKAYANKYREVSVTMIDEIKDKYYFDLLDTTDSKHNLGYSFESYGRVMTLIADTLIEVVEIELIQFDLNKTSPESADILCAQMKKRLDAGESFWDLRKKYGHTSAYFFSGPKNWNDLGIFESLLKDSNSQWITIETEELKGFIRATRHIEDVQAYYVIGYNSN